METNETKIFFDAALEMALRAEIDHELAQTPSPAELKRKYPDTSRWDARLYAALKRQTRHSHMRKRLVMVLLVTALLAAAFLPQTPNCATQFTQPLYNGCRPKCT